MARKPPRNRAALERRIAEAATAPERAWAEYDLGLFHDNNSREKEAIPHYEAALRHGLSGERKAQCLAWLASSLCKTGKFDKAEARLGEARAITSDSEILSFLDRLERRLERDRATATWNQLARLLVREHRRPLKP